MIQYYFSSRSRIILEKIQYHFNNDKFGIIYDHFKIDMNDEFIEKFDQATHANSEKEKSRFSVNKGKTKEEIFDDWKKSVPDLVSENEIQEIEKKCRVMMKLFGYRTDILGQNDLSANDPNWNQKKN